MAAKKKRKRRSRAVLEDQEAGGVIHRPRTKRPHLAEEYQDKGYGDVARELTRNLRVRHQRAVIGFDRYTAV